MAVFISHCVRLGGVPSGPLAVICTTKASPDPSRDSEFAGGRPTTDLCREHAHRRPLPVRFQRRPWASVKANVRAEFLVPRLHRRPSSTFPWLDQVEGPAPAWARTSSSTPTASTPRLRSGRRSIRDLLSAPVTTLGAWPGRRPDATALAGELNGCPKSQSSPDDSGSLAMNKR